MCSDILGIPYREEKAKVLIKDKTRREQQKYVCISTSSTAGCKHWHGWQEVVDYLNSKGYKVVVIQKEPILDQKVQGYALEEAWARHPKGIQVALEAEE